jgi:hypothetical protein
VTTRTRTNNLPPQPCPRPGVTGLPKAVRVRELALLAGLLATASASPAQAKPAVRHTVDGVVVNGAKAPVAGAIVYLENPKSLDVQSYLTDAQGRYHFSQISPQTDYEVWAEQNGIQSKHTFISQFSSHVHFHFVLKLAPKKRKVLGVF